MKRVVVLCFAIAFASCTKSNPVTPVTPGPNISGKWLSSFRNVSYSITLSDSSGHLAVTGMALVSSYLPEYIDGYGTYDYPKVSLNLQVYYPDNCTYHFQGTVLADTTIYGMMTAPSRDTLWIHWMTY